MCTVAPVWCTTAPARMHTITLVHKAVMLPSHAWAPKKIKLAAPQMAATNSLPMAAYLKSSVPSYAKLIATACSCTVPPNKQIIQIIDDLMLDKLSAVETDSIMHLEEMDCDGVPENEEECMYSL